MFIGQYKYNLDSKGRVVIPLDYRRQMGATVIANKGYEKCITIYTLEGWEQFSNTATSLNAGSQENRLYKRYIMASAFFKELDPQGRINLDDTLIQYAGITKEVVIVGAGDVIEIWSTENWQKIEEMRDQELVSMGDRIASSSQR